MCFAFSTQQPHQASDSGDFNCRGGVSPPLTQVRLNAFWIGYLGVQSGTTIQSVSLVWWCMVSSLSATMASPKRLRRRRCVSLRFDPVPNNLWRAGRSAWDLTYYNEHSGTRPSSVINVCVVTLQIGARVPQYRYLVPVWSNIDLTRAPALSGLVMFVF